MVFNWADEDTAPAGFTYPDPVLERHLRPDDAGERGECLLTYLKDRARGFWDGSGSAYSSRLISRRIAPEMYRFEWLVRQGSLSEQDARNGKAWLSFLTYVLGSSDYSAGLAGIACPDDADPVEPTLCGMGGRGIFIDLLNAVGTAGQVFSGHPEAATWRQEFSAMWDGLMTHQCHPESGVWSESHTHWHQALQTLLPTLLRRRADGIADAFEDPRLHHMLEAGIQQIAPRDAYYDDCRRLIPFGDHGVEVAKFRYLYRACAEAIAPHNPGLAGRLAWAYKEMKGSQPCAVQPIEPGWASGPIPGLGFFFRTVDETGRDALLALRAGPACGCHHQDSGSIQFVARGRSLIVDTVFSELPADYALKHKAAGHSRWCAQDLEPAEGLWRFNQGWIDRYDLEVPFPYAVGVSPIFMRLISPDSAVPVSPPVIGVRAIVQLAPTSFLVHDRCDEDVQQVARFHVPGDFCVRDFMGVRADYAPDCRLRIVPITPSSMRCELRLEEAAHSTFAHLRTTEVRLDLGRQRTSAYLVMAGRVDDPPPMLKWLNGAVHVTGDGFDVEITLEHCRLFVRDTRTRECQQIELDVEVDRF
jgi:hypothetical protein